MTIFDKTSIRAFVTTGLTSLLCTQSAFATEKVSQNVDANTVNQTAQMSAARPCDDKWALVIGLGQFQDRSIKNQFGSKNAQDFSQYLVHDANFAPDHVHTLVDGEATRAKILSQLGEDFLPKVATANDLVVVYISSAAMQSNMDIAGLNYLATFDTKQDNLFGSGIPMQDLLNLIRHRVNADRLLMILDAPYSGAAMNARRGLARSTFSENASQIIVASSNASETSWPSLRYKNSVFTKCFIDSLRRQRDLASAFNEAKANVQREILADRQGKIQTPAIQITGAQLNLVLSEAPSSPR